MLRNIRSSRTTVRGWARALASVGASGRAPGRQGLYDPDFERDACGVGLVASLKKEPTRRTLVDCNEMLVRMSHRGGCGCDPQSGDGAGMLVAMPDSFLRQECAWELPAPATPVGMCFLPQDEANAAAARRSLERVSRQRGMSVLGWRVVPTDNSDLGEAPLASEPRVEQLFLAKPEAWDGGKFARELYRAQSVAQLEAFATMQEQGVGEDAVLYINSLSPYQITYKGQLTPEQVLPYFGADLGHDDFLTHLALVHSRFSTNTFPSWSRSAAAARDVPQRRDQHARGNKNWMRARGLLRSPAYGDDTNQLLPVTSDEMSDSGNFDGVLQLLTTASERTLPEVAMMMVPEAWQDNDSLSDAKKAFYEYNSCLMEPWDGPALIAFTDSNKWVGATLDRNGLRPARYYVTNDDRVLVSSEVGVIPWLKPKDVKTKSRLEPGKMFLLDLEAGRVVPDDEIKEAVAAAKPYGEWLEQRRTLLAPMAIGGKEGFGSMGNDAALAVLSSEPRPPSDYFKQLFAQVTNPPIDPIREELVMSLVCPVGPESNLLDPTAENCARLVVDHPVLTPQELAALTSQSARDSGWAAKTLDMTFDRAGADLAPLDPTYAGAGATGLQQALEDLCTQASLAVQGAFGEDGAAILVLSDVMAGPGRLPIPSLLAVGAVHQHLLKTGQRGKAALFLDCGDAKEVHDVALAVGFGADGVCPRVAYQALSKLKSDGLIAARMRNEIAKPDDLPTDDELHYAYRKALAKGLLKVMSKMGISTLQSYKGAQIFEAVGLHADVVDTCFSGTPSRIGGASFDALQRDVVTNHNHAWGAAQTTFQVNHDKVPQLPNPGQFHYRDGGETHLNTPAGMVHLQAAALGDSREAFKRYSAEVDAQNDKSTLRGILRWKPAALKAGLAKNVKIDDVEPAKDIVKRFVTGAMSLGSISRETHEALAVAMNHLGGKSNTGEGGEDPIQIKMAQGAKPGEGGELPGYKVSDYIAECRGTTPGVGLISPPPHHDIYSIEDLAQLIHDLKCANPEGDVSVKLVSEVGVGVIAAGVAKAKADHIVISAATAHGAAAWTGIKCAGLPWELGIAEAQQTLVLNDLRDRIRLQTDGQLKTRDPEHAINFFFLLAEEMRATLASLGMTSMDDLIGAAGDVLEPASELNPTAGHLHAATQDHELDAKIDNELIAAARSLIDAYAAGGDHAPVVVDHETTNLDRTLGTMLSSAVSKACGKSGLPDGAVTIRLSGSSGQSLGFTLAPGVTIEVLGDANDGCGKGLSGARSGVLAINEGLGDHGCEYMTGGRVVVLGATGRNFAAGMSGGVAYVYDPHGAFPDKCNMGMVELGPVDDADEAAELRGFVQKHLDHTDSDVAKELLGDWDAHVGAFVRVMPTDSKAVIEQQKRDAAAAEFDAA
ncbi:hypothetical protein JL720_1279 [Aureococcus anophagefferens]|nr:hypothetical protein JL720_1279 [Aureococcus anophagefferens]